MTAARWETHRAGEYLRCVGPRDDLEASTFLFADIAGSTALTEAHGDEDAAELARTFFGAVGGMVSDEGGELVVEQGREVGTIRHRGTHFRFCSLGCIQRFAESPDVYVG
jgi:class 3 adenylate cyclase